MMLSDIREFKASAGIPQDQNREDTKILFCLEWASTWIEEYLNRKLTLKSRTEYYNGTACRSIQLRSRPVYIDPLPQVWVDGAGYYGSSENPFPADTQLEYGKDFCIRIDQDDGTSRSGLLYRINEWWPRPSIRQRGLLAPFLGDAMGNVKVIYTGGWTVDQVPGTIRMACNLLANRIRYILPLGMELNSESYEERSISIVARQRDYLLGAVKPMLFTYRNVRF